MNSATWKGIAVGLGLFLTVSAIALLTPARVTVLKAAGRDYAALRLERRVLAQETASPQAPARLKALETRVEAFDRRNASLSPFGLLGSLIDLWPWFIGLGVALPVLGGLIGAQVKPSGHTHARSQESSPMPEHTESQILSTPSTPLTSLTAADGPDVVPPPPPPPETWSWNAKPAARTPSGRPKTPPVKSPNGDSF
jgi:hypothetical protein